MGCAYYYDEWTTDVFGLTDTFNGFSLKQAREAKGYSLEALAIDMNKPIQYLMQLEEGMREPSTEDFNHFEVLLGVLPTFFYLPTIKLEEPRLIFVCGEGIRGCHFCGKVADYLCDCPLGNGKTCDLPICDEHRQPIGAFDFCPLHPQGYLVKGNEGRKGG